MSANQIPNLNTLRRGAGRGRFRGRGGLEGASRGDNAAAKDKVVQQTDNDASLSRLSAVELGYLHDPFARATLNGGVAGSRRYPIINRGTYVRTTAIDRLVDHFLNTSGKPNSRKRQIISLGAGSDTRVFRLLSDNPSLDILYHELDFPTNTIAKIKSIRSSPLLHNALRISGPEDVNISPDGDALHSKYLHIHPVDLRTLSTATSPTLLQGVDRTLPTLLISECCLIYLSPTDAVNVLSYFTQTLFPSSQSQTVAPAHPSHPTPSVSASAPLALILYEPIRPDDPFGRTMVSNLAVRGIHLQTLNRYASLSAERERLREHGFVSGQGAADVDFLWERWVSAEEKERVAELEMLDEIEEWKLLASHYCVAWGWREEEEGYGEEGGVFGGWKGLEG
ncbi:carboxy methyl transferase for protein phosphatase 2A [Onygenales sp. PD_12]|nr:carboxy methyl transferase for protein phosphatase 2A [Onygenales sp. PD_12]